MSDFKENWTCFYYLFSPKEVKWYTVKTYEQNCLYPKYYEINIEIHRNAKSTWMKNTFIFYYFSSCAREKPSTFMSTAQLQLNKLN